MQVQEETITEKAERQPTETERIEHQTSTVYDLSVILKKITVIKEVLRDRETGDSQIPPDLRALAPKKMQHSYQTIEMMCYLHAMMMLPYHRLSQFFSTPEKPFPKSQLFNLFHFQARCFCSVYLYFAEIIASKADLIQMDDTKIRVLESDQLEEKALSEPNSQQNNLKDDDFDPKTNLDGKICSVIGGPQYRKNTPSNQKPKLKNIRMTCLAGIVEEQPVVFYRSHHGTAGDCLSQIIKNLGIDRSDKPITLLSDGSSDNNPDKDVLPTQILQRAGCMAHARRAPFRHRDSNDMLYGFLRAFGIIAKVEAMAKVQKNKKELSVSDFYRLLFHYRNHYARKAWNWLKKSSEHLLQTETQESHAYKSAKYIINNWEELIYYLKHPELPADNNYVERLLRGEKLIQNNSKFRVSYEGRAALDIIRSVYVTAQECGIDARSYAVDLMRNRTEAEKDPANWTPWEWEKRNR